MHICCPSTAPEEGGEETERVCSIMLTGCQRFIGRWYCTHFDTLFTTKPDYNIYLGLPYMYPSTRARIYTYTCTRTEYIAGQNFLTKKFQCSYYIHIYILSLSLVSIIVYIYIYIYIYICKPYVAGVDLKP